MSPDEFENLVRRHGPRVTAYVRRRVGDAEDAADIVAETLAVAWRRRDALPAEPDVVAYLIGIARRQMANHRRGRGRAQALAARIERAIDDHLTPPPAPDALAVREALACLRADDRELLTLVAWDGFATAEAAAIMGLREATVRKRLERARTRLAAQLARQGLPVPGHAPPTRTPHTRPRRHTTPACGVTPPTE